MLYVVNARIIVLTKMMKRENKATINCDLFCLQTELTVIWGTTGGQYINNGAIINKQVSPQT